MNYFAPKKGLSYLNSIYLVLLSIAIFIIIWFSLNNIFGIEEITLPKLTSVGNAIIYLFTNGDILKDILISLTRVIFGFSLAVMVGVPLGILCGTYKSIQNLLETHLNFLRFIPTAAMLPLLILWFGVGEAGKIILIFIRALPYLVLYISSASANVEKEYLEMGKIMGTNQRQILTRIIFPRILPQIWDICRIEFGSSWSTVILAEVLGANSGIGYRLVLAERYVHITELFSLIIISGITALLIDAILRFIHKKLFPWSEKERLLEI
jgi:NitT/TauT family transport system permease protein